MKQIYNSKIKMAYNGKLLVLKLQVILEIVVGRGDFVYQGEKINLEMKKQAEQDLCLKYNEGNQLLIYDANV